MQMTNMKKKMFSFPFVFDLYRYNMSIKFKMFVNTFKSIIAYLINLFPV